jgi:hypothetical protein
MFLRQPAALALTMVLAAGASAAAVASPQSDVMATVHQFVDGFNKGATKEALAACASPASIIDDFPPHEWQGAAACADWASAYAIEAKKNGITDGIVTLGQPRHVDITGSRAYVVVSANYTYKLHGKPVKENGSMLTVALRKLPEGWRITGWAWSRH